MEGPWKGWGLAFRLEQHIQYDSISVLGSGLEFKMEISVSVQGAKVR